VADWSKAWVCDCSIAGIADSNPAGAWMSVCCKCCVLSGRGLCDGPIRVQRSPMEDCLLCVLSGRGLCDGLIPRPEESYG
jgi:hypothetical protein